MCGLFATIGGEFHAATLDRLAHRGPDASRMKVLRLQQDTVCLGHRRLSVIDLGDRADQPMASADGRYWLVFNGAIYNYRELRLELERSGHTFSTDSDSEVLLQALSVWGEHVLPRLIGMFAFVFVDVRRGSLLIGRDPFGIKPLYWARWRDGLAFSSEIAPLFDLPGVSRRSHPDRVWRYLVHGISDHGDATMFADVFALPAASSARVQLGKSDAIGSTTYWKPRTEVVDIGLDEAAALVREMFLESVALHLRSDVAVASTLSGGLDSSAIVGAIRELNGRDASLAVFSFVSPRQPQDESRWIELCSQANRADSKTVEISPGELVSDLDRLIRAQEEPFGSTSIYAQYRVMALAHQHGVKVLLDGQGADELLGGYRPFLGARLAELLRAGRLGCAVGFLRRAKAASSLRGISYHALNALLPRTLAGPLAVLAGRADRPSWFRGSAFCPPALTTPHGRLQDVLLESLSETVLPALLRYEDRNSMAFSIESRVPFLTIPIAETLLRFPSSLLISDLGETKSVFRHAMRGLVPDPILERRDKIAFATPESAWAQSLRTWIGCTLESDTARACPYWNHSRVIALANEMLAKPGQGRFQLWRWVNFARWTETMDVYHA